MLNNFAKEKSLQEESYGFIINSLQCEVNLSLTAPDKFPQITESNDEGKKIRAI